MIAETITVNARIITVVANMIAVIGRIITVVAETITMVAGKNTEVFVLETMVFAAAIGAEETRAMVCGAQNGVTGKNPMVAAAESAFDERKTGLGERKTTLFISDCGRFFLEIAVFIPSTGVPERAMGARIVLDAVRNTERVVETIRTGACVIETGRIGAETSTHVGFYPRRIRGQPVGRCATAARRRRATSSASATGVPPREPHDASPMPEPLPRFMGSNTTKNEDPCEGTAG